MLLVFTVATSMHQQVAKCLQIRKAYIIIAWNCLENTTYTHIATNTELKEVIYYGLHHLAIDLPYTTISILVKHCIMIRHSITVLLNKLPY